MKYQTELIIELPLDEFIKKLDNPNNMRHWQRGLSSFEHISGSPRKIGAKMKLNYIFGKRAMSLTETITHINLPKELNVNYDSKGMHNVQKNYFELTPEGYTKWVSVNEFIPTSLKMRIITILFPNTFKKQSLAYLKDFKNFAENNVSVKEEYA